MALFDIADLPYLILGALTTAREEVEKVAKELVDKGKGIVPSSASEKVKAGKAAGESVLSKGAQKTDDLTDSIAKTVQKALDSMGIITKADITEIDKKISAIEKKLEKKTATAQKAKESKEAK